MSPDKHLPLYVYIGMSAFAYGLIALAGWQEGRTGSRYWRIVAACGVCLLMGAYALLVGGY